MKHSHILIKSEGDEIPINTPITIIGRSPECELQLEDEGISRRHAQLEISEEGQAVLRDLGSRNGTWVNNQKIEAPTTLKSSDQLRFGSAQFIIHVADAKPATSAETITTNIQPSADINATATWKISAPMALVRNDGIEFGLTNNLHLGRDKTNEIVLKDDRGASQFHAKIELTEGHAVLTDLNSRNGTWVNGKRISTPMALKHGDRIQLGNAIFRLRVGDHPLQSLTSKETRSRSGCMGFSFIFSSLVGLIGVGAISLALLAIGAFIVWPKYFAPAPSPTATATITVTPTTTSTAPPTEIPGAAATEQAEAERHALRALVWVISPVGDPDKTDQFSSGSGSLVSADGHVLTNFHVVGDTETGEYYNLDEWIGIAINLENPSETPDTFYRAEVIHADPEYDLALLHIFAEGKGEELPSDLTFSFIKVGNSDELEIGDPLAVIGFPDLGGNTPTFTRGTVSGFLYDEELKVERGWIKTDAEVNPGNSGGMAINGRGELIGVPTQVYFDRNITGKISEIRPINLAQHLLEAIP